MKSRNEWRARIISCHIMKLVGDCVKVVNEEVSK